MSSSWFDLAFFFSFVSSFLASSRAPLANPAFCSASISRPACAHHGRDSSFIILLIVSPHFTHLPCIVVAGREDHVVRELRAFFWKVQLPLPRFLLSLSKAARRSVLPLFQSKAQQGCTITCMLEAAVTSALLFWMDESVHQVKGGEREQ